MTMNIVGVEERNWALPRRRGNAQGCPSISLKVVVVIFPECGKDFAYHMHRAESAPYVIVALSSILGSGASTIACS